MKIYQEQNVLEATMQRLRIIFSEFDNVYISISGGKDSSVMLQLANIVAKEMDKKFDVLYIDLEAQYKHTIEHVEDLRKLLIDSNTIGEFYWVALPLALRNAVSQLQPKWICWEEEKRDLWVRDLPTESINENNNIFPFFRIGEEFEEFMVEFAQWYKKQKNGKIACGVGIRSDEELLPLRLKKLIKIIHGRHYYE